MQDALELAGHAEASGSDIWFLRTPMMQAQGGAGVFRFFIWNDELSEAIDYGVSSGLDELQGSLTRYWTCAPERPDSFTHWGGAFKCAAAQLGLPVGDHPDSRPPQQAVTEAVAKSIREIYEASALADDLVTIT